MAQKHCIPSKGKPLKTRGDQPPETPARRYEPTPKELAAIRAHFAKKREKPTPPHLKLPHDGTNCVTIDHPDPDRGAILLANALGTTSAGVTEGLLNQYAKICLSVKEAAQSNLNFMVDAVAAVGPKDEIEAMLASQMVAVHMAAMRFGQRLNQAQTLPQQESAERAFTKLTRTFAAQVEALKRYRTGGEQKVTVHHVTVNSGGQAVVGNLTHAASSPKVVNAPALTAPIGEALLISSRQQEAVPATGGGGPMEETGSTS